MNDRIRINPGDTIPLFLDEKEWRLVKIITDISDELSLRLRSVQSKKEGYGLSLDLDDLQELTEIASEEAEFSDDEYQRRVWNALFARLRSILDTYTDGDISFEEDMDDEYDPFDDGIDGRDWGGESEVMPSSGLPPQLEEKIQKLIGNKVIKNQEEFSEIFEIARSQYNEEPQKELGGLSPNQVFRLIDLEWDDPNCALKINKNLSLDRFHSVLSFENGRRFLQTLMDEGGKTKATTGENLNRKFVALLLERLVVTESEMEEIREMNKVINEPDAWPVHIIRILLELAGAIKRRKKEFSITAAGKKWLKEENAGLLYANLFKAQFLHMNLSYLDGMPESPELQSSISYTLYRLSSCANKWSKDLELSPQIVLPFVLDTAPARPFYSEQEYITRLVGFRIFSPLCFFGLLEIRIVGERGKFNDPILEIRKTPLYDEFMQFVFAGD